MSGVRLPESGGLSSTSVLFEASWVGAGTGFYVARMAPEASAVPVFPRYDLPGQFDLIARVAASLRRAAARLRWNEPDGEPLGTPFFVMDQVDGRVPLDNPPYVFAGWLLEAAAAERARLEQASVAILAPLHAIPEPAAAFPGLRPPDGTDALRHHVDQQRAYYRWALAGDGIVVPIIERSLDWLDEHWPRDRGPDVLSWGDARIGNIIYRGFEPGRRARLGDGRPRPARAGRRLVHLPAPVLPGHRRVLRRRRGCPASCAARTWSGATRS